MSLRFSFVFAKGQKEYAPTADGAQAYISVLIVI